MQIPQGRPRPRVNRMTDAPENITLSQTSFAGCKNLNVRVNRVRHVFRQKFNIETYDNKPNVWLQKIYTVHLSNIILFVQFQKLDTYYPALFICCSRKNGWYKKIKLSDFH